MSKVRWIAMFAMLGLFGIPGAGQDNPAQVTLRVVKYDGLKDEVIRHRGKVVFVDFWAEFCQPCKRGLPHVLQLQRQYAKDGLVVITVSVDDLHAGNPEDVKGRVLGFLKQAGAGTTNLLLDEHPNVRQEKLRLTSIPCYYIFNRQGKWTQFGSHAGDKVDYSVIDRLVYDLLQEK